MKKTQNRVKSYELVQKNYLLMGEKKAVFFLISAIT